MAKNTKKETKKHIIYSVYVRNHSKEGTFEGVKKDLDRIKALGTDYIWLMPIHPIGVIGKKGELGCPYSIQDFRGINPSYGTMENFKELVDAMHEKGMKCMIDVVYNHTSHDSVLLKEHPEFFYKKEDGTFGNRCGEWGDVYDLDYNVRELWEYQIETLCMWAEIVDGFRCDVASCVPTDFWAEARNAVAQVKPDFLWLAESVHPEMIKSYRELGYSIETDAELYRAFDIEYQYDIVSEFDAYLAGEKALSRYLEALNTQEAIYPDNYNKLRYLENHDSKRIASRIDMKNYKNWYAFLYFLNGTTLLYAGEEHMDENTPSLFEIDLVKWNQQKDFSDYLAKLAECKKQYVPTDAVFRSNVPEGFKDTVVMGYYKNKILLQGICGLKNETGFVKVNLADGVYQNLLDGNDVEVKDGKIRFDGAPIWMVA